MKIFKILENDSNQRLDKFLCKLFPEATRSLIFKFNRKNKIKIKSDLSEDKFKKRDNEYKLQIGDEVKIFLTDEDFQELMKNPTATKKKKKSSVSKEKIDEKDIVYEDDELLVINKNPHINVHPGDHKTKEVSLIERVHDYLGDKFNSLTFKPSLVHRIDRDTSGILLIAKKKNILTNLVDDFKSHKKVKKTYYAVVLGKLSRKKGTIKKNILRIENATNENKIQVNDEGQTAITHYNTLKEHIIKTKQGVLILTEVEIKIETGRMHQIRVHMASLGNPIIGDKTYGDKKLNSFFLKNFGIERQALHARKIEFFHYGKNEEMKLVAKIKDDLVCFIDKIKK